jgi:hypothetical protein
LSLEGETLFAYIAGLVDGEGYFGKIKCPDKRCTTHAYHIDYVLDVSNISKPLLARVIFLLGYGHIAKGQKPKINHHQCYHLRFYQNNLRILLPRISKYLILKQDKSRQFIKELESIKLLGRCDKGQHRKMKLENVEEKIGVSIPDRENVADMKEVVDQLEAEGKT